MINGWYSLIIVDNRPGNDKMLEIIIDIFNDNYQNNQISSENMLDIVARTLFYHGYYHDKTVINGWYSLKIVDNRPRNDKRLEIIIDILDDNYQNNQIISVNMFDTVQNTVLSWLYGGLE